MTFGCVYALYVQLKCVRYNKADRFTFSLLFYSHYVLHTCLSSSDLLGSPAQDCTPAAPPSPASEAGSLFPVQRHGADLTDVCVCPAGTLDGLHMVHDWTQGDRDQWNLGDRWVLLSICWSTKVRFGVLSSKSSKVILIIFYYIAHFIVLSIQICFSYHRCYVSQFFPCLNRQKLQQIRLHFANTVSRHLLCPHSSY